ncbi:MAG: DUF1444 family protein [Sphingobacteriaceae bacterium]|nr:MAG: DUF1444 family protein [Sphingobacteriaceae bacterium]
MKYWILFAALILTACSNKKTTLSAEEFANKYLLELKKSNPSVEYSLAPDLSVNARYRGGEYSHFPDNAYREYLLEPDSIEQVLSKFTQTANELYDEKQEVNINKIVPVIKPADFIAEVKKLTATKDSATSSIAFNDYNNELSILYAEDKENSLDYLTKDKLKQLHISQDSILSLALKNFGKILPKIERIGNKGRYIVTAGGTYEASLLLLNSFWSSKNFPIKGDIVVAVPSRDILLITGSRDKDNLNWVRTRAQESYDSASYQISPFLFRWNGKKFLKFE